MGRPRCARSRWSRPHGRGEGTCSHSGAAPAPRSAPCGHRSTWPLGQADRAGSPDLYPGSGPAAGVAASARSCRCRDRRWRWSSSASRVVAVDTAGVDDAQDEDPDAGQVPRAVPHAHRGQPAQHVGAVTQLAGFSPAPAPDTPVDARRAAVPAGVDQPDRAERGAVRLHVTARVRRAPVPSPSWPTPLLPQHQAVPSVRATHS